MKKMYYFSINIILKEYLILSYNKKVDIAGVICRVEVTEDTISISFPKTYTRHYKKRLFLENNNTSKLIIEAIEKSNRGWRNYCYTIDNHYGVVGINKNFIKQKLKEEIGTFCDIYLSTFGFHIKTYYLV